MFVLFRIVIITNSAFLLFWFFLICVFVFVFCAEQNQLGLTAKAVLCNQRYPAQKYKNLLIPTQKTKQVGVVLVSRFFLSHLFISNEDYPMSLFIIFVVSFLWPVTDEQLFSIMESICGLVDSIPEHELIGLSCGNELLLKRAQRCVDLSVKQLRYYHFS